MKKIWLLTVFIVLFSMTAAAQGTGFNFQGRLNDGTSPANGQYDLQFQLFDAIAGGNSISPLVPRPNTVLINGVFSTTLDFGSTAFNSPNSVFIEISLKPGGSTNAYTILGPRQQLTVVPFAVRAMNSTNADNAVNSQNAVSAQNATNAGSALIAASANALNGIGSSGFIQNTTVTQPNSSFNISGNGFINGKLSLVGDTVQNRDRGGFVKAMVYVDLPDGVTPRIARCFNGVTGFSTGTCGFTVQSTFYGKYIIDFGFPVNDRFYSVTAQQFANITTGSNITTGFFFPGNPNQLGVKTNAADVTFPDSHKDSQFMLIIY